MIAALDTCTRVMADRARHELTRSRHASTTVARLQSMTGSRRSSSRLVPAGVAPATRFLPTGAWMSDNDQAQRSEHGAEVARLLAEVAHGSREAFDRLYQRTSGKLFGVCLRLIPDRAEAEEVLQATRRGAFRNCG